MKRETASETRSVSLLGMSKPLHLGSGQLTLSVTRTPDNCKIRAKMLYASSKDAIRKSLVGISAEIQATDSSEISYDAGRLSP